MTDDAAEDEPPTERVYEAMEPLEPYTTGELASALDAPRAVVRKLLNALVDEKRIRKKEPEPERVIWIREPPAHVCPKCDREFEIKFLHPIFSAVQFCPRCGAQLE